MVFVVIVILMYSGRKRTFKPQGGGYKMERFNGEVKDREKVMHGLKKTEYSDSNRLCPMGITHNYTTMTCQANPSCPTGTSFNQASSRCEATAQPTCLAPGQYNPANNRCEATPKPPTGGGGLGECPVTYPTNSDGICITSPGFSSCPADKCESQAIQCTSDFSYNSAAKQCQRSDPPLSEFVTNLRSHFSEEEQIVFHWH